QRYSGSLWELIQRFSSSLATDPRYKVYSLFGITQPYPNGELRAGYTLPWQPVFTNATRYIIKASQTLDIIDSAGSTEEIDDLPSWVPHFPKQAIYEWNGEENTTLPLAVLKPGRFLAGGHQMGMTIFSQDNRRLATEAIIVGKVLHVLPRE